MSREQLANALKFPKCMCMDVEKLCISVEYVSEIAGIQRSLCKYRPYSRRQWHYMPCEKLINIRLSMFTYFDHTRIQSYRALKIHSTPDSFNSH